MSAGLQISDGNGLLIIDTTTWTGRVVGIINMTASGYDPNAGGFTSANQSGSAVISTNGNERLFYFCVAGDNNGDPTRLYPQPNVSFSGSGTRYVNWSRSYILNEGFQTSALGVFVGSLIYGVY